MKTVLLLFALLPALAAAGEDDSRTVVHLSPQHRAMVLAEMRQFLSGLQEISDALSRGDMQAVASTTHALGRPMTQRMPPDLRQALPEAFRKLGFSVHSDFDQMALDAEALGDAGHTLYQLGQALSKCVSCHEAYQIREDGGCAGVD